MTPRELSTVLSRLPETRLEILAIAREATAPDGSIDAARVREDVERFDRAEMESRQYAEATRRIINDLKSLP